MSTVAVILAGGVGSRMGALQPKQFLEIAGKPVIAHTIGCFERNCSIDAVLIVCVAGWESYLRSIIEEHGLEKVRWVVEGGNTGHDSTRNALFFLRDHLGQGDYVVIHDAARPIVPQQAIDLMLHTAHERGNASLAVPCHETVIYTDDQVSGVRDIDRSKLMRVQTPQAYEYSSLLELYDRAEEEGEHDFVYADLVLTRYGKPVYFSKGFTNNVKITRPEDIPLCESLMKFTDDQLFSF